MTDEVKDDAVVIDTEEKEGADTNKNGQEDSVALQEKLDSALKAKSELTARAKKAEEELKALKAKPQENNQENNPQLSDELKLIARGLSDEEIEQAKVIAKGKGVSLTEAVKDPLFVIYQGDLKDKERKEKAKLGASKGSGELQEDDSEFKSGMTREEHQKAWKKSVGKK